MKVQLITRLAISLVFGVTCAAIVLFGLNLNSLGETIVKADIPASSVKIVEAENCLMGIEESCSTEGSWKSWLMPEFSNGALITNEHPTIIGLPLPVTLTITFTGTGASILYRQDVWYGSLGVKIDDQSEYHLRQQGVITNLAKACFEVEGESPHTLTLSGGKATGVITVDAIAIFDESEPCGTKKDLDSTGILVPAYFHPASPEGAAYWRRLANAAKKIGNKLVVIANPLNGPGGITDTLTYSSAISEVVSNGGKVIGYIHTCYGDQSDSDPETSCPKTKDEVKQDIDKWYELYPMISGIFLDEVSTQPELVPYYQWLYDYIQGKQPGAIVVLNFGVEPDQAYSGIGSSILCTFEGPFSHFVGWLPPNWLPRERSCSLVYETDNWLTALKYLSKKSIGWFYFTSDTLDPDLNPWDTLPTYFECEVKKAPCSIYLPILLENTRSIRISIWEIGPAR